MSQVKLRDLDGKVRFEKKRDVEHMIACLRVEWVIRGIIAQMLPPVEGLTRLKYYPQVAQATAESVMPSAELPGLRYMLNGKIVRNPTETTRRWLHGRTFQAEMSV